MATERIIIDGQEMETLKELLRPNLKAIFIWLNPSPSSVAKEHYFQGRLGRRFWQRLQEYGIVAGLMQGREDDDAFAQGFGFADLVRRPTPNAKHLRTSEKRAAVDDLLHRPSKGRGRPKIIFVYKEAARWAQTSLEASDIKCTVRLRRICNWIRSLAECSNSSELLTIDYVGL